MHKVLIVDNSAELLEIMMRVLERKGYRVKTLDALQRVCEEINEFKPDLLVLDIYLNDGDGRHLCRELKMDFQTKSLPIILFSAFPSALKEYNIYLADDFMEKPFDIKTLINKIQLLLSGESITG